MANDRIIPTNGTPSVVTSIIKINGAEIPRTYEILTIVTMKEVNKIPFAKIVLKDGDPAQEDFPASNDDLFAPGNEIEVLVGYEANEDLLFKGIIVKHCIKMRSEGSSMLKLDCRDKLFKTTLVRNNKYFAELKDSDAINDILGNYDLETAVEDTSITHPELVQFEQTDFEFILRSAKNNGFLCVADDGVFNFQKPNFDQESLLTLTYGATVLEFDGEIDARLQYDSVSATSWDAANQELLEVVAVEPSIEEAGNITANDLAAVNDSPTLSLRHGGSIIQDDLQSWADAELLTIRLAKLQGRVKFQGFPSIKPNNLITLQGFGDRFSGLVFVSGVRHEIQGGTWQTDIQFGLESPWSASNIKSDKNRTKKTDSSISGLQIGVVSQIEDDPDGEHRILVKLPIIDAEAEGVWARIATLDAGKERGTFFLPEEGDEVVVGFINGVSRNPIILGMLHSSKHIAPFEATSNNFEKGYVSKSGIKLVFDDDKKSIRIETPAGKFITIDEDEGVIQLEDDNSNKIIMNSDGILIDSGGELIMKSVKDLKMESGINLEQKAGASFKAEGSAGAELSTSAVAILKGSLVQIN